MFLVTSVLAAFYCLPVELVDYAESLASAVASISNVYFAQTAGYFDAPAETKPLLHTWSLGVEEQFYFAAPLVDAVGPSLPAEARRTSVRDSSPWFPLPARWR